MAPSPQNVADPPSAILERGQAIDRFVVLGLVGRGGMGEVYAAYDPELDRKVAIKLLRTRGDTTEGKTRLLREAQAIAKLQHPNIVVVYDVGTFGDSVFIAMEFVEGRTAGGWLHAQTRTRREILQVYLAAGRGLAAAHAAGLVHRDFKPDNVMVTNDGQVRVMDFGLARQMGEGEAEAVPGRDAAAIAAGQAARTFDSALDAEATVQLGPAGAREVAPTSGKYLSLKLTQTGAMLGTPAYMAPEQFAVKATDARTDQFSFCVALYEALYGNRPFAGDTFVALMTSVITGAVADTPAKAKVPGWMRKVVLRGLATEPDGRFSSMTALLAALETDPTVRARRLALGATALLGVAAVALGVRSVAGSHAALCHGGQQRLAGIWEPGGVTPRKELIRGAFGATGKTYAAQAFAGASRFLDEYARRWVAMYGDACEATNVRGEQSPDVLDLRMSCLQERLGAVRALTDLFAKADAATVENAVSAAASLPALDRCADVALLRAVIKPPADEATRARVESLKAERSHLSALIDAGHCIEAIRLTEPLLAKARQVGYGPLLAELLNTAGFRTNVCIPSGVALSRYREAYTVALAAHHDEAAAEAATQVVGMTSTFEAHEFNTPQQWLAIARAMIARIGGHPLFESWLMMTEGMIAVGEGNWAAAISAYEKSRLQKEKIYGPDHPDVFISVGNLGTAYWAAGRYEEALATSIAARAGEVRVLGAEHPQVALASYNEGEALNALHRFAEAAVTFHRALDIWNRTGADPSYLSYGLTGLGLSLLGQHRMEESVAPLEEALKIREDKQCDSEHLGETRFALARALWHRSPERRRAEALAAQARKDYEGVKSVPGQQTRAAIEAWLKTSSARG